MQVETKIEGTSTILRLWASDVYEAQALYNFHLDKGKIKVEWKKDPDEKFVLLELTRSRP